MTPAERIAAAEERYLDDLNRWFADPSQATPKFGNYVLDALCPKGERVVLDRTGDTDRLIRQTPHMRKGARLFAGSLADDGVFHLRAPIDDLARVVWVDSAEGGDQ